MALLLSCVVALVILSTSGLAEGACADAAKALDEHNRLRALHQAPPLKASAAAEKFANDWAATLAKDSCKLEFPGDSDYGLNLLGAFSTNNTAQCLGATDFWYQGSKQYKYTNTPWTSNRANFFNIGSFTAMVWVDTTQLGCGAATGVQNGKPCVVIVCAYSPHGNIQGDSYFKANVLPPIVAPGSPRPKPSPRPSPRPSPKHSPKPRPSSPKPSPKPSPVPSPIPSPRPSPVPSPVPSPPSPQSYRTLLDALIKIPSLKSFLNLASDTGLTALLANENYTATLFAPDNRAVRRMLRKLNVNAGNLDANLAKVKSVLQYHVVLSPLNTTVGLRDGRVMRTLLGTSNLTVQARPNGVFIVGDQSKAKIMVPNIKAGKSLLHIVSAGLVPNFS